MTPNQDEQADAFMRKFVTLLVILAGGVAVVVIGGALYLDAKLERMRDTLGYQAPIADEFEAPLDADALRPVAGQLVYVPAYSHVYHQDGQSYLLTVTLSIRNTDPEQEIILKSANYYGTKGDLVKRHLEKPIRVGPLATVEFLVERDDKSGGSGANFLVDWVAEQQVAEPIIEAVMIDTQGQQGISFLTQGKVVRRHDDQP